MVTDGVTSLLLGTWLDRQADRQRYDKLHAGRVSYSSDQP